MEKPKRKVGRPKGSSKGRSKVLFEETRVGFLLKHEAPVEYKLIISSLSPHARIEPPPELIEAIAYASDDDLFHKQKFWQSLITYRKHKLFPRRAIKSNAKKELYYIKIRKNKKQTKVKYCDFS